MADAAVEPALPAKTAPIKSLPTSAESEVVPANFSVADVVMPLECAWIPFPALFVESPPLFLGGFGEPVAENGQSFPLPTDSAAGGAELQGEELVERMRMLHTVETELTLQMEARCGEPFFSPPLPVPFGWRPGPDDVVPWPKPNAWKQAQARLHKVFVGGLTARTTGDDLRAYFSKLGDVRGSDVLIDHATGRSRGFGFVEFAEQIPDGVVGVDHLLDGRKCGARSYAGQKNGSGKPLKPRGPKKGNSNRAENLAGSK